MNLTDTRVIKASWAISNQLGILSHIMKMPNLNNDPRMLSYGIFPSKSVELGGEDYEGRSSGCGWEWKEAIMGTVGETIERYCCAFYNPEDAIEAPYKDLTQHAVHPSEFALFHDRQYYDDYEEFLIPFKEDTTVNWYPTIDLTNGKETLCPGIFIYMPFSLDKDWITVNTSTGLASHTNMHKAMLTALYEVIERDSFVITWMQNLVPRKIKITSTINQYLRDNSVSQFEWHFFDVTYDLDVPTVFAICFGKAEFGEFVAVGSATRSTYAEALKKTIKEASQAIPYFRWLLDKRKDWEPTDDFNKLMNFEDHSIFYNKRKDMWHVFDKWRDAKESFVIDFSEQYTDAPEKEIKRILSIFRDKGYNVLFKDITTPDANQLGFYSIKIFVPQLIQMSGAYPVYFLGSDRLYDVPKQLGYTSNDYDNLNKFPHPFP